MKHLLSFVAFIAAGLASAQTPTNVKIVDPATTKPVNASRLPDGGYALNVQLTGGAGNVFVDGGTINVPALQIAQGTALGSNVGPMCMGSVASAAPSFSSGVLQPLSLTTAGRLRIDASGTVMPIGTGAATASNQTNGLQKAITRSGNKGAKVSADITSTNLDDQTEALDIFVHGGWLTVTGNQAEGGSQTEPFQQGGLVVGEDQDFPQLSHNQAINGRYDENGKAFVNTGGSRAFYCALTDASGKTECLDDDSSYDLMVTDVVISNNDTAQIINVFYTSGANCTTESGKVLGAFKLADGAAISHTFGQHRRIPSASNRLCCDGQGSGKFSCAIGGYKVQKN